MDFMSSLQLLPVGMAAALALLGIARCIELVLEKFRCRRVARRARIEAELDAKQEELRQTIHRLAQELHRDALRSEHAMNREVLRWQEGEPHR